jgi:hypothetical protein
MRAVFTGRMKNCLDNPSSQVFRAIVDGEESEIIGFVCITKTAKDESERVTLKVLDREPPGLNIKFVVATIKNLREGEASLSGTSYYSELRHGCVFDNLADKRGRPQFFMCDAGLPAGGH